MDGMLNGIVNRGVGRGTGTYQAWELTLQEAIQPLDLKGKERVLPQGKDTSLARQGRIG